MSTAVPLPAMRPPQSAPILAPDAARLVTVRVSLIASAPPDPEAAQVHRRRSAGRGEFGDHAPDLAGQERLLDHRPPGRLDEIAQRRGERVAGDEHHALGTAGPAPHDLLVETAPVEVGHSHVGQDRAEGFLGEPVERLAAGHRGNDAGARAALERRVHRQRAAMRLDDAEAHRESDAGRLGRGERLEHPRAERRGDARAVVRDSERQHAPAGVEATGDADPARRRTILQRLLRVDHQVEHHLVERVGVREYAREFGQTADRDLDPARAERAGRDVERGVDDLANVDRPPLRPLLARHREERAHDAGATLGRGTDLDRRRLRGRLSVLLEQHGARDDDRQRIVELVRDAREQRARRVEHEAVVRVVRPREVLRQTPTVRNRFRLRALAPSRISESRTAANDPVCVDVEAIAGPPASPQPAAPAANVRRPGSAEVHRRASRLRSRIIGHAMLALHGRIR